MLTLKVWYFKNTMKQQCKIKPQLEKMLKWDKLDIIRYHNRTKKGLNQDIPAVITE